MKMVYVLNKAARRILGIWLLAILTVVLISQGKRLYSLYGGEVGADELKHEVEHFEKKEYVWYEEDPVEEVWEGKLLCIGDKKTYWTKEQMEMLPKDHKVDTEMDVLTVTLPSRSLIFRESSVSYVKYSCLGETGFSDEEIAYYRQAAANQFTYERHTKLRLKDAAAYKEFIPNENIDKAGR